MTSRTLVQSAAAVTVLAVAVAAAVPVLSAQPPASVPYPTEYRSWAVVKTSLVGPQARNFATRGGFHHFYANDKAMEGYRTGRFPDGSIIVDEGVAAEEAQGVDVGDGPAQPRRDAQGRQPIFGDRRLGLRPLRGRQPDQRGRGRGAHGVLHLPFAAQGPRLRLQHVPPVAARWPVRPR